MSEKIKLVLSIDSRLKEKSETLYNELGLGLDTAINVFLRQSLREGGLPFALRDDFINPNEGVTLREELSQIVDRIPDDKLDDAIVAVECLVEPSESMKAAMYESISLANDSNAKKYTVEEALKELKR